MSYVPRRGRRPASSVTAAAVVAAGGAHYSQAHPPPHHGVNMGLDVHPGVYQPQLIPGGGQPENGLLPHPPPPPGHPQHMPPPPPPHVEVAHAAGMMHIGGMPVSQSQQIPAAYMDSSAAMMISPGPPPPVATMVAVGSHHSSQQSHDTEAYMHHHHQQQQEELQQQQHHHDEEHHHQQQQQLATQIIHASANSGSNMAVSDEGTMTPPVATQQQVVISQHVLAPGSESVTPNAVTPEPVSMDPQTRVEMNQTPVMQGSTSESTNVVLGGSHAPSPYQTPAVTLGMHTVTTDHTTVVNSDPEVHQIPPLVVIEQPGPTGSVLPSDECSNPIQQQQPEPEPETASVTHVTANQETASSSALVEEQVTMATVPGDNQS